MSYEQPAVSREAEWRHDTLILSLARIYTSPVYRYPTVGTSSTGTASKYESVVVCSV